MLTTLSSSLRILRRRWALSLAVVTVVALGTTANTAVFSLLERVLSAPLPYPAPNDLVHLSARNKSSGAGGTIFPTAFFALEEARPDVRGLAAVVDDVRVRVSPRQGAPFEVNGALVSARLFSLLGARTVLGRVFAENEDDPGQDNVVVLSQSLWSRRFGADPTILGRTLRLNDQLFTVIGVLSRTDGYPAGVDLWLPNPRREAAVRNLAIPVQSNYDVVGRLAPGVSLESARKGLSAVYSRAVADLPRAEAAERLEVVPLAEAVTGGSRQTLLMLQLAAATVLLICSSNVAALLLARSLRRRHELAVRGVLGASTLRLLAQISGEHLILFLAGGGAGLLGALLLAPALVTLAPSGWLDAAQLSPSVGIVCLFSLGTTVACGVVFGSLPALAAMRPGLMRLLRTDPEGRGSERSRLAELAVVVQIALALALLIGAGLLTDSLLALQAIDLGLEPNGLVAAHATFLVSRYGDRKARIEAVERLRRSIADAPAVTAVGATQYFFLTDGSYTNVISAISGHHILPDGGHPVAASYVTPGYFAALGVPILRGGAFSERDSPTGEPTAVVTTSLAAALWPGEDALGQSLEFEGRWFTVVGVSGDLEEPGRTTEQAPDLFVPYPFAGLSTGEITLLVRSPLMEPEVARLVEQRVRDLDADQTVDEPVAVAELIASKRAPQTYAIRLLAVFAACAVLLASLGIYALLTHAVVSRRREIGIRMALGASGSRVRREVFLRALAAGGLGLVVGGGLGALLGRGLQHLTYGVTIWDPLSWLVAFLALGTAVFLASWVPLRRAASVDPASILRQPG